MLKKLRDGPAMRNRILACIAESPGIHMNDAANQLDVAWNTLGHHVRRMETKTQLITRKVANRTELYPAGMSQVVQALVSVLRDPKCTRVLKEIHEAHPDVRGVYEMRDKLGMSLKVTLKHVNRLLDDELVVKIGTSRPRYKSNVPRELASKYLGTQPHKLPP